MKKTLWTLGAIVIAGAAAVAQSPTPSRAPDPRSMGGGDCRDNPYNCADAPNPLPAVSTVWLEEMTWMDVRDAMKAGKTTVIIPTGGVEPNGPWLALGTRASWATRCARRSSAWCPRARSIRSAATC